MHLIMASPRVRTPKQPRPDWSKALVRRRMELGLKQEDITERSHDVLKQGTVSDLERGKVNPLGMPVERFHAYLNALEWSLADFAKHTKLDISELKGETPKNAKPIGDVVSIRFLGAVSAGLFAASYTETEPTYLDVPRIFIAGFKPDDLYTLKVTGESMASQDTKLSIPENSIVVVHKNLEPTNAREVVCYLEDEGIGVIKRWNDSNEGTWLTSYNTDSSKYPPIPINQNTRVRFCGVVIGSYRFHVIPPHTY